MDPSKFTNDVLGEPTSRPGDKWAFWSFEPASLAQVLQAGAEGDDSSLKCTRSSWLVFGARSASPGS